MNNFQKQGCLKCSYFYDINKFCQEYTIWERDTLESISKKELGDPTKAIDIINLNKRKYWNTAKYNSFVFPQYLDENYYFLRPSSLM